MVSIRTTWTQALALTGVLSIAITAAIAAPTLRDPETRLFGVELVGRQHDPFTMMEQYESGHVPPPYLQPATDIPGVVLTRFMTAVPAYNALVLITFPLTALLAFVHARHVIGSPAGALVAALLFAFAPFRLAHAAYHVHLVQTQWLPLFFLALWRLIERPTLLRAAIVAGALVLAGAASFYFGMIVAIIAPAVALAYALARSRERSGRAIRVLGWTAAAIGATAGAALFVAWEEYPAVLRNPSSFAFPSEALDQHSARAWSYLMPAAGHIWLGRRASTVWRSAGIDVGLLEQQVSIGASVLALALVPLAAAWMKVKRRTAVLYPVLLVTALVAFVCSLPPAIQLGPFRWPMPSAAVYAALPMFRSYARFGVIVSLMLTTLAGAGFAMLIERRTRASIMFAAVLLLGATFEYLPRPASRDVLPTSAHRWLAGVQNARVFDCVAPTPGATAGVARLMNREVAFPAGPLSDCAEPEFSSKLAAFGFSHVIVRTASKSGEWTEGATLDGVKAVHVAADASVFEITAPKRAVYVTELSGFFPREYLGLDTWRWMGAEGSMKTMNASVDRAVGELGLELEAFGVERLLRLTVNGNELSALTVQPIRKWYSVGPVVLTPGANVIGFVADGVLVPANGEGAAADTRALSVRVRRWRWKLE